MGNTPLGCVSGGVERAKMIRVVLPDGEISLMEGPIDAAELMIEHINHMVMHCSTVGAGGSGQRTTMTILQPHERLQPSQDYVLHPIPSPSRSPSNRMMIKPRHFSVPDLIGRQKNYDANHGDKNQSEQATPFKVGKTRLLQKYQRRVADSSQSENALQTSLLTSTAAGGTLRRLFSEELRGRKGHAEDEANDGQDDVVFHLNLYMGWKPALESIPESPQGYHHRMDVMQQSPALCIVR